jgi:hypothetical protein
MTGGFQVLHLVRPLLGFLPEVQSATRKIPFREKLGITPIVTSGMVMQLLVGSKIIEVDNIVREDRALLNGAQKLLGILIAIGEAVAYAPSGMYDNVNQLETGNAILIILQLFLVGHSVPVGGLAYYVTAPSSLADVLANPFRHCSMWSLCCQPVLSSLKHGLKFLLPQQRMLPNSSRNNCGDCQSRVKLAEETEQMHPYCCCIWWSLHRCIDYCQTAAVWVS